MREEGYATHLLRDEAIRLIEQRDSDRPFLLYLAFNAPHLPGEAPEGALFEYTELPGEDRRLHAGMVSEMDSAIGAVLRTLDKRASLTTH